jgi:HSP20 family protein
MANTDRTTETANKQTSSSGKPQTQTQTGTANTPQQQQRERTQGGALTRRDPLGVFLDRLFEDFGLGRSLTASPQELTEWIPNIEVFQRGNELVVRADLPGMNKEDIQVEIDDNMLTIRGERRQVREEEREGEYHSEVRYGAFIRSVPLPEGTIADSAKATFKNGVLEIVLQTPPKEVNQGRKVNIE